MCVLLYAYGAIKLLLSKIESGEENYSDYAFINPNITYESFIAKLSFNFKDMDKVDTIKKLKSDISNNLIVLDTSLAPNNADTILNLIIDKFFETVIINSELTNPDFSELTLLKRSDLVHILENHNELELTNNFKILYENNIEKLEREEEAFIDSLFELDQNIQRELIDQYEYVQQVFLSLISEEEEYEKALANYSLDDNLNISNLYSVIKQASILSYFKTCDKNNVSFQWLEPFESNIQIQDLIEYCLKATASANINSFNTAVRKLYQSCSSISQIKDDQIFVLDANLAHDSLPCNESLRLSVFNITGIEPNLADFHYFNGLSFKCSNCIRVCESIEKTETKIQKFIDCRGNVND